MRASAMPTFGSRFSLRIASRLDLTASPFRPGALIMCASTTSKDPQEIPRDTDYSSLIESDEPVVVQHTRLDSRQAENALLSAIAYPVD